MCVGVGDIGHDFSGGKEVFVRKPETVAGSYNTALSFGKLSLMFMPRMVLQGAEEAWILFD